jgi:hypothetical protein
VKINLQEDQSVDCIYVQSQLRFISKLIGEEGTRLLRDQRVWRDPQVATRRLSNRPAESECLQRKSTSKMNRTLLISKYNPNLNLIQRLIGEEGERLLREKLALGRTRRSLRRGGSRPPAESERLQRKSTQQDERNAAYIYVQSQS